jgi:hypothetical protein
MSCFAIGSDPVPVSFIVADPTGALRALSIYHVNSEVYTLMKVFEIVTITAPLVREHKVEWNSKVITPCTFIHILPASLATRAGHDSRMLMPPGGWQVYEYSSLCIETPSSVVVAGKRLVPIEAQLVVSKKHAS